MLMLEVSVYYFCINKNYITNHSNINILLEYSTFGRYLFTGMLFTGMLSGVNLIY